MDDLQQLKLKPTLSVHDAARLLSSDAAALRAAEIELALAVDRGELAANILRWATEQWEGERLEGNIDRMRTFIERVDLDAWLRGQGRSLQG